MNKFNQSLLLVSSMVIAGTAAAHTTLETASMSEGVRVLNNVQIGHACGAGKSVIGTSVVFPDGTDSTILVNKAAYNGKLSDFLTTWGPNIQPLIDRSVFTTVDEHNGPTGNVTGLWAGGGSGVPNHMVGYVPFRVNATRINPQSCATSVRFQVSIVDVCEITTSASLHNEGVAEFWTSNTLSTIYDSKEGDNSASLTINRNLTTNPLPTSCGGVGTAVEVRVSPTQLQRDMPIRVNGVQIWPK
jgi:hypothetical protein